MIEFTFRHNGDTFTIQLPEAEAERLWRYLTEQLTRLPWAVVNAAAIAIESKRGAS